MPAIRPKEIRTQRNPVSGKLEHTVLDKVQLAYERVIQVVDGKMKDMTVPEQERLVVMLQDRLRLMVRS